MRKVLRLKIPPPQLNNQVSSTDEQPDSLQVQQDEEGPIPNQYIVIFKEQWEAIRTKGVADKVRSFTNIFLSDIGIPQDSVVTRFEFALRGFTSTGTSLKTCARERYWCNSSTSQYAFIDEWFEKELLEKNRHMRKRRTGPSLKTWAREVKVPQPIWKKPGNSKLV